MALMKGDSNKLIAAKLNITEKTVKFHLTELFKASGVKSRLEYVTLHLNKEFTERMKQLQEENEALKTANVQASQEYEALKAEYGRAWITIKNANLKVIDTLPMGFKK